MAEEHRNIRTYEFRETGFIPGVAGYFSGGTQVLIDEDTKEVLAQGPLGTPLVWPKPEDTQESDKQPEEQGVALPDKKSDPNATTIDAALGAALKQLEG